LNLPFPAANFDLVWSLESGEHMPDKHQFLQEMHRVLKPQGIMILATWCHRPIESPDTPLTAEEQRHLKAIYHAYHLPYVISLSEYGDLARECGFQDLRMADWSKAVAPFWTVVMESALTLEGVLGLFRSGWQTIQGALAIVLMRQGYDQQLIRYGVLIARK
jgi:tocopherol O-methyltransferase